MRLIDANSIGKKLSDWCSEEYKYHLATLGATPKVVSDTLRKVIKMITEEPIIEADPVRHAHWIKASRTALPIFKCSLCDGLVYNEYRPFNHDPKKCYGFELCPECGAIMDEEENQ